MKHPATAHIERLQNENRRLREALHRERIYRQQITVRYRKRLLSRFLGMIELMTFRWPEVAIDEKKIRLVNYIGDK